MGDQITADVVVSNGAARLENVVVVKKGTGAPPAPSGASLKPGADEQVPDFALLNQDGKRVHLGQYRGKAVLLTFIYTRCPLADYCPLMTHNFAQIEKGLAKTPDVYAKTHLLSISFDPKYDTPEVLRKYASAFVDDQKKPPFDHWEFASILEPERPEITRFFNLFYSEAGGQVTHSLSTNIIDPDGHIYRSYYDNDWKPADVLSDLTALVADPARERTAISSGRARLFLTEGPEGSPARARECAMTPPEKPEKLSEDDAASERSSQFTTVSGHPIRRLYTPADLARRGPGARSWRSRRAAVHARHSPRDVSLAAVDHASIRGLWNGRRYQCALSIFAGAGAERAFRWPSTCPR